MAIFSQTTILCQMGKYPVWYSFVMWSFSFFNFLSDLSKLTSIMAVLICSHSTRTSLRNQQLEPHENIVFAQPNKLSAEQTVHRMRGNLYQLNFRQETKIQNLRRTAETKYKVCLFFFCYFDKIPWAKAPIYYHKHKLKKKLKKEKAIQPQSSPQMIDFL